MYPDAEVDVRLYISTVYEIYPLDVVDNSIHKCQLATYLSSVDLLRSKDMLGSNCLRNVVVLP